MVNKLLIPLDRKLAVEPPTWVTSFGEVASAVTATEISIMRYLYSFSSFDEANLGFAGEDDVKIPDHPGSL